MKALKSTPPALIQAAHDLAALGFAVVPCGDDKKPCVEWDTCKEWPLSAPEINVLFNGGTIRPEKRTNSGKNGVRMFAPCTMLGVATGNVSTALEVIDIDTKHDPTGTLWINFFADVERVMPDLYPLLVIVQTQSGGYHIPYRAPNIESNQKLALRLITPQEREQYYQEALIKEGGDEAKARKQADNHKVEVLLETRGNGGYAIVPPSPKYTYIQGDYSRLPTLTHSERDALINLARSYNEVAAKIVQPKAGPSAYTATPGSISPFDDYNQRGDVVQLLCDHGWRVVHTSGERVHLLRPGNTTAKTSGNYHAGLRLFTSWSTSTEFEAERAYNPVAVFATLECDGDWKQASQKLRALGYGTPPGSTPGGGVPIKHVQVDAIHVQENTIQSHQVAAPGDTLQPSDIYTTHQEAVVVITSPGPHAMQEVERVLDELLSKHPRVYVHQDGVEDAACIYKLHTILHRYDKIQERNGGALSDRDVHAFLDEVVQVGKLLEPMHCDMYRTAFLAHPGVATFGITPEAYKATEERLRYRAQVEKQTAATREVLSRAEALINKGNTTAAVNLIKTSGHDLAMHTRVDEFNERMRPLTTDGITELFKNAPTDVPSGFIANGREIMIPSASISYFAGATGHGKTTMLINCMLYMAEHKQCAGRVFHFITYEMDTRRIYGAILNAYIGVDVGAPGYTNIEAITAYFKTGTTESIRDNKREYFISRVERMNNELIKSGRVRIHHVEDNSGKLVEFITHLHQEHGNIGAVFIDYVQLIDPSNEAGMGDRARHEQVKGVAKDLMRVAIDTGLPLIAASQLNRQVNNHYDVHKNNASEGSDIEKSAALMLGVWNNTKRPIGDDTTIKRLTTDGLYTSGTMYIKVMKARYQEDDVWALHDYNGNAGKIKMHTPDQQSASMRPRRDVVLG